MTSSGDGNRELGPWNPGISSQLPREYLPLSTMFRPENVSTSVEEAQELRDFCGLALHDLVAVRPERLVVHELLIRVTGDFAVPDGDKNADLGISFREIVAKILSGYVAPHNGEFLKLYEEIRQSALERIAAALSDKSDPPPSDGSPRPGGWRWRRLFGDRRLAERQPSGEPAPARDSHAIIHRLWEKSAATRDPLELACLEATIEISTAIMRKRGSIIGDPSLIAKLAAMQVCNGFGSERLGEAIEPCIAAAIKAEGYRLLPAQKNPVVMNVKGASASGKSTMRPRQRQLAERLDIPWQDFALISPDIWRKFLLDYDSLGPAYRYAGTLTGHEVEIIDRKLDKYMAAKAADGKMSHLLIDRFRFDSFVPESDGDEASRLLTRFGDLVYMFFMITPPEATVERAWKRGLEVGRYKAVDDLLAHNIEAYTGMPQLFFTWALRTKKRVHYEFLDNSVPKGSQPRTVAFGWNGEMNILDIKCLLDIDRFRKINVDARNPDEIYDEREMSAKKNVAFLVQCAERIPILNFVDERTGCIYARLDHGKWIWRDSEYLAGLAGEEDARAGLQAIGLNDPRDGKTALTLAPELDFERADTVGAWGSGRTNL